LNEYRLPRIFQKELFEFQQAAVKIAAKKLDKRDGVLIGDVVGLGKTITACALSKMFEESSFWSTLIICPPNLIPMWREYIERYDLKAHVISVAAVQGQLGELKRFKLVIIDESHNLRNDQRSRYRAIKNYLDENESKVILLSATPYNKSFIDLSNQLRLFLSDDKDIGISPERYIADIGGQVQFMADHTETFIRSIKAFEFSQFSDDWRELMRLYLVRRTRSFIKTNYGETDAITGKIGLRFPDGHFEAFPERVPKRVEYEFNPNDKKDFYAKLYSQTVVDTINHMSLPRYGLKNYLEKRPIIKATEKEEIIMQNLSRAGKRLMGFCRTNFFKRLESSGYSFPMRSEHHLPLPIIEYDGSNVVVTFLRTSKAAKEAGVRSISKLTPEELEGYEWIRSKGEISAKEYSANFEITPRTTSRHLSKMLKLKIISTNNENPKSPKLRYKAT
jgi:hypothetical protein